MNKKKILYVDDEQLNLTLFDINFKKKYNVTTAISGKQALEYLENNADTDIVISDMKMPQMTGIEFISIAKEKYPNINFYWVEINKNEVEFAKNYKKVNVTQNDDFNKKLKLTKFAKNYIEKEESFLIRILRNKDIYYINQS